MVIVMTFITSALSINDVTTWSGLHQLNSNVRLLRGLQANTEYV